MVASWIISPVFPWCYFFLPLPPRLGFTAPDYFSPGKLRNLAKDADDTLIYFSQPPDLENQHQQMKENISADHRLESFTQLTISSSRGNPSCGAQWFLLVERLESSLIIPLSYPSFHHNHQSLLPFLLVKKNILHLGVK